MKKSSNDSGAGSLSVTACVDKFKDIRNGRRTHTGSSNLSLKSPKPRISQQPSSCRSLLMRSSEEVSSSMLESLSDALSGRPTQIDRQNDRQHSLNSFRSSQRSPLCSRRISSGPLGSFSSAIPSEASSSTWNSPKHANQKSESMHVGSRDDSDVRQRSTRILVDKFQNTPDVSLRTVRINARGTHSESRHFPTNSASRNTLSMIIVEILGLLLRKLIAPSSLWFCFLSVAEVTLEDDDKEEVRLSTWCLFLILLILKALPTLLGKVQEIIKDRDTNRRECTTVMDAGYAMRKEKKKWADILVGDLVWLHAGEMCPADIAILCTSVENENTAYVQTRELFKTSYEQREAIPGLDLDISNIRFLHQCSITCEDDVMEWGEKFTGTFRNGVDPRTKELQATNVIFRDEKLKTTRWVLGVVLSTGLETWPGKRYKLKKGAQRVTPMFIIDMVLEACVVWAVLFLVVMAIVNFRRSDTTFEATHALREVAKYAMKSGEAIPITLFIALEVVKVISPKLIQKSFSGGDIHITKGGHATDSLGSVGSVFLDGISTIVDGVFPPICATVPLQKQTPAIKLSRSYHDHGLAARCSVDDDFLRIVENDHRATIQRRESGICRSLSTWKPKQKTRLSQRPIDAIFSHRSICVEPFAAQETGNGKCDQDLTALSVELYGSSSSSSSPSRVKNITECIPGTVPNQHDAFEDAADSTRVNGIPSVKNIKARPVFSPGISQNDDADVDDLCKCILICCPANSLPKRTDATDSWGKFNEVVYKAIQFDSQCCLDFAESRRFTIVNSSHKGISFLNPRGEMIEVQHICVHRINHQAHHKYFCIVTQTKMERGLGTSTLYVRGTPEELQGIIDKPELEINGICPRQGHRCIIFGKRALDEAETSAYQCEFEGALSSFGTHRLPKIIQKFHIEVVPVGALYMRSRTRPGVPQAIDALVGLGTSFWLISSQDMLAVENAAHDACLILENTTIIRTDEASHLSAFLIPSLRQWDSSTCSRDDFFLDSRVELRLSRSKRDGSTPSSISEEEPYELPDFDIDDCAVLPENLITVRAYLISIKKKIDSVKTSRKSKLVAPKIALSIRAKTLHLFLRFPSLRSILMQMLLRCDVVLVPEVLRGHRSKLLSMISSLENCRYITARKDAAEAGVLPRSNLMLASPTIPSFVANPVAGSSIQEQQSFFRAFCVSSQCGHAYGCLGTPVFIYSFSAAYSSSCISSAPLKMVFVLAFISPLIIFLASINIETYAVVRLNFPLLKSSNRIIHPEDTVRIWFCEACCLILVASFLFLVYFDKMAPIEIEEMYSLVGPSAFFLHLVIIINIVPNIYGAKQKSAVFLFIVMVAIGAYMCWSYFSEPSGSELSALQHTLPPLAVIYYCAAFMVGMCHQGACEVQRYLCRADAESKINSSVPAMQRVFAFYIRFVTAMKSSFIGRSLTLLKASPLVYLPDAPWFWKQVEARFEDSFLESAHHGHRQDSAKQFRSMRHIVSAIVVGVGGKWVFDMSGILTIRGVDLFTSVRLATQILLLSYSLVLLLLLLGNKPLIRRQPYLFYFYPTLPMLWFHLLFRLYPRNELPLSPFMVAFLISRICYLPLKFVVFIIFSNVLFILLVRTNEFYLMPHALEITFEIISTFCALGYLWHLDNNERTFFRHRYHQASHQENLSTLLHNILPAFVVKEVLNAQQYGGSGSMPKIAMQRTGVSVVFCDVADLNEKFASHDPRRVVRYLDKIFRKLDVLVERSDMRKIETVGATYLVSSDLENGIDARNVAGDAYGAVCFAIDMFSVSVATIEDGLFRRVKLVAGVHTGWVIAGLVGSVKPQYAIFGDTVNTASRMMSTASVGMIQISQDTYELVAPFFNQSIFTKRHVEAKGKGRLETYVLFPSDCASIVPPRGAGTPYHPAAGALHSNDRQQQSARLGGKERYEDCGSSSTDVSQEQSTMLDADDLASLLTRTLTFKCREMEKRFAAYIASLHRGARAKSKGSILAVYYTLYVFHGLLIQEHYTMPMTPWPVRLFLYLAPVTYIWLIFFSSYAAQAYHWVMYSGRPMTYSLVFVAYIVEVASQIEEIGGSSLSGHGIFSVRRAVPHGLHIWAIGTWMVLSFQVHAALLTIAFSSRFLSYIFMPHGEDSTKDHLFALMRLLISDIIIILCSTSLSRNNCRESRLKFWLLRDLFFANTGADKLIKEMFPAQIASDLARDRCLIAYEFTATPLLFADIAGFTAYCDVTPPDVAVDFITSLFSAYDLNISKRQGFKVCTIGDCYVAMKELVPRAPNNQNKNFQHSLSLILFASWMLDRFGEETSKGGCDKLDERRYLKLRIGMHLCNFVGGVIGTRVIRFDIWGRDVHICNKVEAQGVPGSIVVSRPLMEVCTKLTSSVVADFQFHATIDVGRQESLDTYLVNREGIADRSFSVLLGGAPLRS